MARVGVAVRSEQAVVQFVVRPDRSMDASGLTGVFAALSCGLLGVGLTAQVLLGAYPVLGCAIATSIALGWALRASYCQGCVQQVVSVGPDRVIVEAGVGVPSQHWQFDTHWLQIVLTPDRHVNHLFLRSHGRAVELGTFLSEPERLLLARQLVAALAPYSVMLTAGGGLPGRFP
jgi:uncharacterized membrane protein